jgi:hypothetical protein
VPVVPFLERADGLGADGSTPTISLVPHRYIGLVPMRDSKTGPHEEGSLTRMGGVQGPLRSWPEALAKRYAVFERRRRNGRRTR